MLLLITTLLLAPIVALIILAWSEGVGALFRKRLKFPPTFPSQKYEGQESGWIETIVGMIGPQAPYFAYGGYSLLPKGYPWIVTGNFPHKAPSGYGFAVADIHLAREILMSPHSKKSIMYREVNFLTCGYSNIFTANGHRWKHARKFIAPAFSSNHIKRMVRICSEHLQTFIDTTLDVCADEGKAFDIGRAMIGLTLSIISEAAFEYQISREEMHEFTSNLETAAECFVIMNPLHQKLPWLFPQVWRATRAAKTVQSIAYRMMDNYTKKHADASSKEHEFQDDTIISRIMTNPNYANDDERAADIAIFLAAGHDTTAYSISWTILETFKNRPAELAQYRKKVAQLPDRDDWTRVDELQLIIKEGMRLNPVLAMGTVRDVGKEITYQQGNEKVVLPKDSSYFINLFPMFRNPEYYDDPDEFRPSRWVNPKTELAHVPFSIGPRSCIGQTLANSELHTVVSVLLARYDFTIENEGHPEYLTTLKPVNCMLIPKKLF